MAEHGVFPTMLSNTFRGVADSNVSVVPGHTFSRLANLVSRASIEIGQPAARAAGGGFG